MEALSIKDIEKFLIEASKKEEQSYTFIIRGHRDSVIQWMEMFHKEIREQCGKI
jgi:hypothetical protein